MVSETTLLYALSTLAQTCAALAAFIGALGLYRLQSLVSKRQEAERTLRGLLGVQSLGIGDVAAKTTLEKARYVIQSPLSSQVPDVPFILQAVNEWESVDPDRRRSSRLLFWFEVWNLFLIFVALVGFNFVNILSEHWATSLGLWMSAVGTSFVTGIMLLETLGSLPNLLRRFCLQRILSWLERE